MPRPKKVPTKRKVAETVADPTLATTSMELKGKQYTLCFDMGSLAEAEMHFRRAGENVNLLNAIPDPTVLSNVLIVFPCAVHRFHPELSFKDAQDLIMGNYPAVLACAIFIMQAWNQAVVEPDPASADSPPLP
jgi:hypothetical protein